MKKIIILSTQRSGSTWLVNLLNKFDSLEIKGELFLNRQFIETKDNINKNFKPTSFYNYVNKNSQRRNIERFLSEVCFSPYFKEKPKYIGFKLMYNQLLRNLGLLRVFFRNDIVFIHMKRRDSLANYVSVYRNVYFGIDHSFNEGVGGAVHSKRVHLSILPMVVNIIKVSLYSALIDFIIYISRSRKIDIYYEDLRSSLDNQMNFIAKTLGISGSSDFSVATKKIGNDNLNEIIENIKEVRLAICILKILRIAH